MVREFSANEEGMVRFTWGRRAVVAVFGFTVLLIGLVMVVLPGPAVVVIPLGLAILATEFVWARRLLEKARATASRKERKPKPLPRGQSSRTIRSFGSPYR
jgi:uncharacterized protein (TIGR02611 family)